MARPKLPRRLVQGAAAALLLGLVAFQVWGAAQAPFHPDESTQLFMSSDFETLLTAPFSMAWDPAKEADLRQRYRELDAPLTRTILGLGRALSGQPALPVDWDWAKDWQANRQAGALPDPALLLAGRLTITLLLPLSMAFLYLAARKLGGRLAGFLAAGLLGSNALVLLHGRRSMAEGALTLGVCLALWGLLEGDRRPWLAGLGIALAFNAKQSALALFPVGLLAVCWLPEATAHKGRRLLRNLAVYIGVFVLLSLALNPLWWRQPLPALRASWAARQELLQRQVGAANDQPAPPALTLAQTVSALPLRAAILAANLSIAPLAFYEIGNYREQTAASEQAYLSNPLHSLQRGLVGGALFLVLAVMGTIAAGWQLRKSTPQKRRMLVLILLAGLLQCAGLLLWVPLPWQRYVIPLVPMACLWAGYGLGYRFNEKETQV